MDTVLFSYLSPSDNGKKQVDSSVDVPIMKTDAFFKTYEKFSDIVPPPPPNS